MRAFWQLTLSPVGASASVTVVGDLNASGWEELCERTGERAASTAITAPPPISIATVTMTALRGLIRRFASTKVALLE
jgi:hypothetical protein